MRGRITGKSCPGSQTSSSRLASPTTATSSIPSSSSARRGGVDLRQAAVDDDEVGRVGELARPPGDLVDRAVDASACRRPPAVLDLRSQLDLGRSLALVEVAPEAAGQHLVHRRGVVHVGCRRARSRAPRTMNRRYSDLRGRPSSKTTIDATTLVPCTWLTSKHSMRSGASSSSRDVLELLEGLAAGGEVAGPGHLVPGQATARRCGATVSISGALVAALRDPQVDAAAAQPAEPRGQGLGVGGQRSGTSTSRGTGRRPASPP